MRNRPLMQIVVRVAHIAVAAGLLSACAPTYGEGPKSEADPGATSKTYDDKMGKMSKSGGGTMQKSSDSSY